MVALNYFSKPVVNQRFYDLDVLSVDTTLFPALPRAEPLGGGVRVGYTVNFWGWVCTDPYSTPKLSVFYIPFQTKVVENHTLTASGTYPHILYIGLPPVLQGPTSEGGNVADLIPSQRV